MTYSSLAQCVSDLHKNKKLIIIDDCIDGSTWFDIMAYEDNSPFLDRWGQLNESALYRFRENLEDKVAGIDWGITDGLEPVTKTEVTA